jgi:hypothetical protein
MVVWPVFPLKQHSSWCCSFARRYDPLKGPLPLDARKQSERTTPDDE